MPYLSIIIPVADYETDFDDLLKGFQLLDDVEIIIASSAKLKQVKASNIKYIKTPQGRAQSMNAGAKEATGKFLWFVHADTILTKQAIQKLITNIKTKPNYLYYFDLVFDNASHFMSINNYGVWFRSHILGVPFGDQAFAISKYNFNKIGGYPENLSCGEDHAFIWHARQHGIKLKCTNEKLITSSRKYKQNGWLKITALYQYLWIKQAFPQYIRFLTGKKKSSGALVVFVKTPKLSPLKTRLAKGIGKNKAIDFYLHALKAVESRSLKVNNITPYYAVAEKNGLNNNLWQNMQTMHSNTGDLGKILDYTYKKLLNKHSFVLLSGTDI